MRHQGLDECTATCYLTYTGSLESNGDNRVDKLFCSLKF